MPHDAHLSRLDPEEIATRTTVECDVCGSEYIEAEECPNEAEHAQEQEAHMDPTCYAHGADCDLMATHYVTFASRPNRTTRMCREHALDEFVRPGDGAMVEPIHPESEQ